MQYRNIDDNYDLYYHTKRYYNCEINESQLNWILKEKNFSKKEIDNAKHDYYLIHVRTNKICYYITIFLNIVLFIFLLWKTIHLLIDFF